MNLLDLFSPISAIVEKIVAFIPDPVQRAKALADAQAEMVRALSASDTAQSQVNAVEAASPSIFVAGWRPAFGWLGVGLVAYAMVLRGVIVATTGLDLPEVDTADMWPLVTGMLGLTAARSYDKSQGTDTRSVVR